MKERDIEDIRKVPDWSVLAFLTKQVESYTTLAYIKRWIIRRYDKLMAPALIIGGLITGFSYTNLNSPTPFFDMTIGEIIGATFLIFLVLVLTLFLSGSAVLAFKAGRGKGTYKFNLRDKNGIRNNEMEIDTILKEHKRINRDHSLFHIFDGMFDKKGVFITPDVVGSKVKMRASFESLSGDPIIAEVQQGITKWEIEIPADKYPENIQEEEDSKDKSYESMYGKQGQMTALVERPTDSLAFQRLTSSLGGDMSNPLLIHEDTSVEKFIQGHKEVYIHVLDFTSDFEYKGKKYPGLIFLHEKKQLSEIFPEPSKAYCMIGIAFGDVPVITTEFTQIDEYEDVPIFYPTTTRERLVMIGNLGAYDERIPSARAVNASMNFIKLYVAEPIMQFVQYLQRKLIGLSNNMSSYSKTDLALSDEALDLHTKLGHKKEKDSKIWYVIAGMGIMLFAVPWIIWIVGGFFDLLGL